MGTDLFNGRDPSGWTGDVTGYEVAEGILVCRKGGKNLATDREYSDFVFQFEFRLEESGNNGIGIRVARDGYPSRDGMEIQIPDHDGRRYHGDAVMADGTTQRPSWLKPWQYHGSIYGITPARTGHLKPVGEWIDQCQCLPGGVVRRRADVSRTDPEKTGFAARRSVIKSRQFRNSLGVKP